MATKIGRISFSVAYSNDRTEDIPLIAEDIDKSLSAYSQYFSIRYFTMHTHSSPKENEFSMGICSAINCFECLEDEWNYWLVNHLNVLHNGISLSPSLESKCSKNLLSPVSRERECEQNNISQGNWSIVDQGVILLFPSYFIETFLFI